MSINSIIESIRTHNTGEVDAKGTLFSPCIATTTNSISHPHRSSDMQYIVTTKLVVDIHQSVPLGLISNAHEMAREQIIKTVYGEAIAELYPVLQSLRYKDIGHQLREEVETLETLIKKLEGTQL